MQSQEFQDLLNSVQAIVSDAYALGRSDALKRVVEVLKADTPTSKPLALMRPDETGSTKIGETVQDNDSSGTRAELPDASEPADKPADDAERVIQGPWWSRPPRRA